MDENKAAKINDEKCISCGACVYQCPWGAINDKSYILNAINYIKESNNNTNYKVYAVVEGDDNFNTLYSNVVDFNIIDEEEIDLNELASKINDALPVDITVKEIYVYETSPNDIRWAEYKIVFNNPDKLLSENAEKVLSADEILVLKKGKQGRRKVEKEVNIKEHIKSFELIEENGMLILNTILSSGTSININPMLLIGALVKDTNTDEQDVDIIKVQSFIENMEIFK